MFSFYSEPFGVFKYDVSGINIFDEAQLNISLTVCYALLYRESNVTNVVNSSERSMCYFLFVITQCLKNYVSHFRGHTFLN